jgi:hypothetical protein
MRLPTPQDLRLFHRKIAGPWPCEVCHNLSQYAEIRHDANHIYCKWCGYERIIDKRESIIVENDGTFWRFDGEGHKEQIRGR